MNADPEKIRVLGELNEAAEEAARIERALTEAQGGAFPAAKERRLNDRRVLDDRRHTDRRASKTARE